MKIRRIQDTLIRAFAALIVFALLLLGTLAYYYLHKMLIQNAEETTMQLVTQLNRVIENYISYMDDIALMAVNNEDVREFMAHRASDSPLLRDKIEKSFEAIRTVRRDIDSVFVITRDGRAIAATQGGGLNPSVDLGKRFSELVGGVVPDHPSVSSAHVENLVDSRYPWVISLVRILPPGPDGKTHGSDPGGPELRDHRPALQGHPAGQIRVRVHSRSQRRDRLSSPAAAHLRKPEVGADPGDPFHERRQPERRGGRPGNSLHRGAAPPRPGGKSLPFPISTSCSAPVGRRNTTSSCSPSWSS